MLSSLQNAIFGCLKGWAPPVVLGLFFIIWNTKISAGMERFMNIKYIRPFHGFIGAEPNKKIPRWLSLLMGLIWLSAGVVLLVLALFGQQTYCS